MLALLVSVYSQIEYINKCIENWGKYSTFPTLELTWHLFSTDSSYTSSRYLKIPVEDGQQFECKCTVVVESINILTE